LDNSGSAAQIVVNTGTHAITAPVYLVGGDRRHRISPSSDLLSIRGRNRSRAAPIRLGDAHQNCQCQCQATWSHIGIHRFFAVQCLLTLLLENQAYPIQDWLMRKKRWQFFSETVARFSFAGCPLLAA
jgi:hypothetical protein